MATQLSYRDADEINAEFESKVGKAMDDLADSYPADRVFENTFAPNVRNKRLPVGSIIVGLKQSAFRLDDLPPDVRKAVGEELRRRDAE